LLGSSVNYLRERKDGEEARVDFSELFFDLVFVFAITQISHYLLHHLSVDGLINTVILLFAVWLVWVYTIWATNWFDPRRWPVRMMLFALMLGGLFLSTSAPEAFGERAEVFAFAYVAVQVGRSIFMVWATRHHDRANYLGFLRFCCWFAFSGIFWIAGCTMEELNWQRGFWVAALAIELVAPWFGYWSPGLGTSKTQDWRIDGHHMAERCGLFVIIALGESILIAGATFAEMQWSAPVLAAFVAAFVTSVAMWWVYFNIGAERSRERIAASADPGAIARLAYSYVHMLIVAGIIVIAVGVELMLAHPVGHHAGLPVILALAGGALLYVFGVGLFKALSFGRWPLSHLAGMVFLAILACAARAFDPLVLGLAVSATLVTVAAWEFISLRALRH